MKTAFKIEHEPTDNPEDLHLLMEIARHGVALLRFKKNPLTIEGVSIYNFPKELKANELGKKFQSILEENEIEKFAGASVFYNFKESILIPSVFFQQDTIATQLDLVYGVSPQSITFFDELSFVSGIAEHEKLYNIYRIPAEIHDAVSKSSFSHARHATSVQVKLPGTNVIQCTIFTGIIKIFLYNNSQLQIVQQFNYKTSADVVYHLLNTCDKHGVSPGEISLSIDGMIDSDSNLYQEIYKYFMHVNFNEVTDDIFLSAKFKENPLHFFTHLTELAKCV